MEPLVIKKGGKLVRTTWNPKLKKRVAKDVSKVAYRYQYDQCVLDKGVTLKDILLLINKNLNIFDLVFGNWTKELVEEGLKGKKSKEKLQMKYLELYWRMHKDKEYKTKKPTFGGYIFPSFHGIGIAKKTDKFHGYVKGKPIQYSVSFISLADLRDLPLKLDDSVSIYNEDDWKEEPTKLGSPEYSLGHILYGIIWELSYHGSPKSRDKVGKELLELSKQAENGTLETVPLEDVLKSLTKKRKTKKKK